VDPFYLDLLRDGKYFYENGDYGEAVENFKIAFFGFLDNPPMLMECYLYLTICFYQIKDMEQAKHYYDEIKRLNLEEHLQEIGPPQSLLDKYYEIDAYFSRLEASSSSPLSPSRLSASSPEAEIDQLKQAIKDNRRNYEAYLRLKTIYLQQNKIKEAKSILQDMLKIDPRNGNAYFELGKILAAEKRYQEALRKFRQASPLLPDNIDLHYETAKALYQLKDYDQAREEFAKVQAINEKYKDTEKFLAAIEEAERLESKRADQFLDLARKEKDLSTKIMYYKQALRNDPSDQEIYFEMSRAYRDEEKYDDAADALQPLLKKSPENTEIHIELARIYLQDKAHSKAAAILKRALAVADDNIEISYLLGRAYMEDKRYEEAADSFHRVLKKDSGYKDARQLLERCLQKIK
jgi:tetratricopeptide (TPR) repeat protein